MRRIQLILITLVTMVGLATASCGVADGGGSQAGNASPGQTAKTRTVKHAMGTTQVPADPQRVVVLDTGVLDAVVSLGVDPVGAVRTTVDDGILDYLEDDVKGTKIVGTITEPNLEAIAALNPDLILSNVVRHQDLYDELKKIAPTVMAESLGSVWKHNFQLFAEALGMSKKADRMLAAYEQRANKLGKKIGNPGKVDVSVVRFLPGEIRIYQEGSYIGTILSDVGLSRPDSQNGDGLQKVISPERIRAAGGDVIFVTTWGPKKKTQVSSVTDSKLWQRLDAVQSGDVHFVPDSYWIVGLGIGAANEVLDDLEKYLT